MNNEISALANRSPALAFQPSAPRYPADATKHGLFLNRNPPRIEPGRCNDPPCASPAQRLHQVRVDPGTDGAFSDETKPDSLRCFRKKRHKRRAIITGKIEAKIESSPDQIKPEIERGISIINPDFVYVRYSRRKLGRMMI